MQIHATQLSFVINVDLFFIYSSHILHKVRGGGGGGGGELLLSSRLTPRPEKCSVIRLGIILSKHSEIFFDCFIVNDLTDRVALADHPARVPGDVRAALEVDGYEPRTVLGDRMKAVLRDGCAA